MMRRAPRRMLPIDDDDDDFADDAVILAKSLEVLFLDFEVLPEKANPLGTEASLTKTKLQAFGCFLNYIVLPVHACVEEITV